MKGITNIPCLHIGSRTGSEGSKTANSYRAIEPAQPETRAVCIIWTESNRPGSFNTTVRTQYQGKPMEIPLYQRKIDTM
uniref:Uncharacterized protein n=1 Tax=Nelumbo nucifera TaxID=4432 RepID=A0A822YTR8_NELNU|nr:TPA_asm: hypothetical protein HUJ06_006143 [Nelumbo nucifera]